MKRIGITLTLAGALLCASSVLAEPETNRALSAQERLRRHYEMSGGLCVNPKSYQGRAVIVNGQTRLAESNLVAVAKMFADATRCNFVVASEARGAQIALTVIDDPKEPTMLLAPMDRWGKVNLARIVDDLPAERAKAKFFESRARKLVAHALSILCGGGASDYPSNLMNAATVRELDLMLEQIPYDMLTKYGKYLPQIGVTKEETATYVQACRQGWAHSPTNDRQKLIWEKVHALPKNPMKIEFDPKKGR